MSTMHRKLLRDLAYMRGQAVAIGMVMACGVATFVMSLSMLESLTGTLDTYYERNRFADVFASVKRAPMRLADRVGEIPGVAYVQARVVERVTLDMPSMPDPASGQIVSLPQRPRDGLNLLHLRSGRFPEGRGSLEVLVSQRFAEAHDLRPGDGVEAILNGRLETLRVVGVALSPEFIYLIAPGSILPENERFGVFWMGREEMDAAFDMEGAFNDLLLRLMPGANVDEVIDRVDDLTDRYGGLGAHAREDQISHKFLANEIQELENTSLIVPVIFLGVAAFLLNIVLSRMIATQREQIATLKAVGYTRLEIGRHYFAFVLLVTVLAVAVGTAGGAWMGAGLTRLYTEFFDFPTFEYTLRARVVVLGLVVALASAIAGVSHALWAAMRLPPAEAMRPQAPVSYRPTVLERVGLHRMMPAAMRMVFRHLERRPIKTCMSILGIAMATAIMVVGRYSEDAVNYLIDFQFNRVQRYDVDVVLTDETDDVAMSTIRSTIGVIASEPYRAVAVRIRSGHRDRRTSILGLTRPDGLHRLLDMSGVPVALPERGIVLSTTMAELFDVGVGDTVLVEAMEGRRPTFEAEVSGLIEDFSGLAAYMNMRELNRRMRDQDTVGGVFLLADAAHQEALYLELREMPQVAAVNVKSSTLETFRETVGRNIALMRTFLIGFSVVIAFGVVYNSARISLAERSRDLATLRVIGFTRSEVAAIQLGELATITGAAIPVGCVIGYGLAWATSNASSSELIRIPFIIHTSTFALAAAVVAVASVGSGLVVLRRLAKLDLISVLKARE